MLSTEYSKIKEAYISMRRDLEDQHDEFMSPKDLKDYLKIGKSKCQTLLASGEIPSFFVGRLRRIKKAEVDVWIEEQRYVPGDRV